MTACPRCGREHPDARGLCPNLAVSPLPDPLIGTRLVDKYDLTGLVGIGGMGRVYEAHDPHLERQVAIKVLAEHLSHDAVLVSRFKREARASAATGHPNIVHVLDFGTTRDGRPFIVMELLRGHDLSEELRERQRLPLNRAIDIAGQTLFGLSAAHQAGIVHRDLKPGNIFLAAERVAAWHQVRAASLQGEGSFVKLLDFGLSRFTSEEAGETGELTKTGVALGTIYYMAPEQIRSPSTVDGRVDLYSVGVILYYCLTGRKPFQGDNAYNIINRILSELPPDARSLASDIPRELSFVLARSMAKAPEDRFQTAEEFIASLRPFFRTEHVDLRGEQKTAEGTVDYQRPKPLARPNLPGGGAYVFEDMATLVDQNPFGARPETSRKTGADPRPECGAGTSLLRPPQPASTKAPLSLLRPSSEEATNSKEARATQGMPLVGSGGSGSSRLAWRVFKAMILVAALLAAFIVGLVASMLR